MTEEPSPTSISPDSAFNNYIRRAREARKNRVPAFPHPIPEPEERARRRKACGIVLGICTSLVFVLISKGVNLILLPGLPLYPSGFSFSFGILLTILAGTIFFMLSISSFKLQNRFVNVLLVLLGLLVFYSFYRIYGNVIAGIMEGIAFSYIFLVPILLIILGFAPFVFLVRWVVEAQVKYAYLPLHAPKRAFPLLILLIVDILSGTLFIFSTAEQKAVREMNELVEQALSAQTEEMLPRQIRIMRGTLFLPYGRGAYHLTANHNPLPTRVTPDGTPYQMPIYVGAQFTNGYWITCRFTSSGSPVECESDYVPPLLGPRS